MCSPFHTAAPVQIAAGRSKCRRPRGLCLHLHWPKRKFLGGLVTLLWHMAFMRAVVQIPPADLLSVIWSLVVVCLRRGQCRHWPGITWVLLYRFLLKARGMGDNPAFWQKKAFFIGKHCCSLLGPCWQSDRTSVGAPHTPTEIPAPAFPGPDKVCHFSVSNSRYAPCDYRPVDKNATNNPALPNF